VKTLKSNDETVKNIFSPDEIDEHCDLFRILVPSGIHSFDKKNPTQMDIQTVDEILLPDYDGKNVNVLFVRSRAEQKNPFFIIRSQVISSRPFSRNRIMSIGVESIRQSC